MNNAQNSDTSSPPSLSGLVHSYSFGPFALQSEIEIAELEGIRGRGDLPVAIRSGGVPASLQNGQAFGSACQVAANEYLLRIAGTAAFYVRNGSEVQVEIEPGAPPAEVATYLLGSVFGALCHQNGLLPLHASAIENDSAVTAFLGDSGAGKSTLAAFLRNRGYRIVSDDICLLQPGREGLRVVPVAGWLKLWRESFQQLGQAPEERNRIFRNDDKFRLYLSDAASERPPLRHIVFIERSEHSNVPELIPLSATEAIVNLMRFTYLAYIPELNGAQATLFRLCGRAMEGASAYRLVAPWGWNQMNASLALLEKVFGRVRAQNDETRNV